MPQQLSIKRFFSKSEKPRNGFSCPNMLSTSGSGSSVVGKSVAVEAKPGAAGSIEKENAICYTDVGKKPSYVTMPTPPSSPVRSQQAPNPDSEYLEWKKLLAYYDKCSSKSSKNKGSKIKRQKKDVKKIKVSLEKPRKVGVNIDACISDLSIRNFTEQLVALELIKDFIDQ